MIPLAKHEDERAIISDLIKALSEDLDKEFHSLGSTTFKQPATHGLGLNACFYIRHAAAIRGKKRMDLTFEPPPELALASDLPLRTHLTIYAALRVPERWCFAHGQLHISELQGNVYVETPESPTFPGLSRRTAIPEDLARSKSEGRNTTPKAFQQWLRESSRSRRPG
jgi:Uma2 family endonuclease